MMEADNGLGLIIWAFVLLLVGMVFIDVVGDYVYEATTLGNRENESITLASSTVTLSNNDVPSVSNVANGSINLDNFISTIGFNFTYAGVITTNGTFSDGEYNITYTFEPDGYIVHSSSRVLIGLIPLFFAITILAVAIYFGKKKLEEMGWL